MAPPLVAPAPPAVLEGLARDILDISLAPQVEREHFPANTKNESGAVGGVATTVSSIYFADKIMITISQAGRLSQWIQVPLCSASPTNFDTRLPTDGEKSSIASHIQPKTLMGAGGDERETMGQTISSQIASLITKRDPDEQRTVVVGIGLVKAELDRAAWFDLLEMIAKVL